MSTEDSTTNDLARRSFLKIGLCLASASLLPGFGLYKYFVRNSKRLYSGKIIGTSASVGHLIRTQRFSAPTIVRECETVIIGGGISGLSAAWWLKKGDYDKFMLLELEPEVGGNSLSGKNPISAYPWGAHYLPLPGREAKYVHSLLQELDVIQGYDSNGLPIYNEYYLCAAPHERLFTQGRWQEGLVPQMGLSQNDHRQYGEFFSLIEKYKVAKGRDGRRAFVIPIDLSSQDPEYRALDKISMAEFMGSKNWNSKYLKWYVNYCCRDDYGATYDKVSAWAGLHYFASRIGKSSNANSQEVLTWPEGNGWLVNKLKEKFAKQIQSNALAFSVATHGDQVAVDYLETTSQKIIRILAKKVIFAAPRFMAAQVVQEIRNSRPSYMGDLQYAPWMVANVSIRRAPQGKGAPLSWDNVSYYSQSLGYVVATHQDLSLFPQKTVLTYYQPLTDTDPVTARKKALQKIHQDWAREIADDLSKMHPGIDADIENIDICLWGHGMVLPSVGYIFGQSRQQMLGQLGHIHFAHSDMSGISIFEEAQYRGVRAATKVLNELGHPHRRMT